MDGARFDDVVRTFTVAASRRSLLWQTISVFLGITHLVSQPAKARRKRKPHKSRRRDRDSGSKDNAKKSAQRSRNDDRNAKAEGRSVTGEAKCSAVGIPCGKWSDCCSGVCEANGNCTKTKGKGKKKKKVASGNCKCVEKGCPAGTSACGSNCCDPNQICGPDLVCRAPSSNSSCPTGQIPCSSGCCDPGGGCPAEKTPCGTACCDPGFDCIPDQNLCLPGNVAICEIVDTQCQYDIDCDLEVGATCCDFRCANPNCDTNNCAYCGRQCAAGQRCLYGICWTPGTSCPPTTKRCGSSCCALVQNCRDDICVTPEGFDFELSTVCGGGNNGTCSLQPVIAPPRIETCLGAIGENLLKARVLLPMLKKLRQKEVFTHLERLEKAGKAVDVIQARSVFQFITGAIGFVLPWDCIAAISDVLTNGQYTELLRCLADDPCSRELTKSMLGIDHPCFEHTCSSMDNECNVGLCLPELLTLCAPYPRPDGTSCGSGNICVGGVCQSDAPCDGIDCSDLSNACNDGVCNATGQCVAMPKQDGTNCGANGRTCQGGQCEDPDIEESYELVNWWGSFGIGNGQFRNPLGVAVDSAGNVYVADSSNDRIQKFSSSGSFITTWGSFGIGNGQFHVAYGIAVDSAGNVYVTDLWNHRIQKFSSSGSFLTTWGSQGSGDGQFHAPSWVAVDSAGNVYVADALNYRIQKFSSSGSFLTTWGSQGSGDGQFGDTDGVAVDSAGNVYVADASNYRIQKFSSSGSFLTTWGSAGLGNGQFIIIEGVAVDSAGNVYVSDAYNGRIQKFSSDGNFITTWAAADGGVAVDSAGNVYVTSQRVDHILKFAPTGTTQRAATGMERDKRQGHDTTSLEDDDSRNRHGSDGHGKRHRKRRHRRPHL